MSGNTDVLVRLLQLEEVQPRVSVPSWFSADTRLGCLTISLEPPQCFAAEVCAADLEEDGDDEQTVR